MITQEIINSYQILMDS